VIYGTDARLPAWSSHACIDMQHACHAHTQPCMHDMHTDAVGMHTHNAACKRMDTCTHATSAAARRPFTPTHGRSDACTHTDADRMPHTRPRTAAVPRRQRSQRRGVSHISLHVGPRAPSTLQPRCQDPWLEMCYLDTIVHDAELGVYFLKSFQKGCICENLSPKG
jgi:hypothetical protein